MQPRENRPGPSSSPGRHKRPRLSAPTTEEERTTAQHGERPPSTFRQRTSLPARPRLSEEARLARLQAIQAGLSSNNPPSSSIQLSCSVSFTDSQAVPSMSSGTNPKEEAKLARQRMIEEALRGCDYVVPSSQAGENEDELGMSSGSSAGQAVGEDTTTPIPQDEPAVIVPFDKLHQEAHQMLPLPSHISVPASTNMSPSTCPSYPRLQTAPQADAPSLEFDDSFDEFFDSDFDTLDTLLSELPGPSAAPAFVTLSRTAGGYKTVSAAVSEKTIREQQEKFELWEREESAKEAGGSRDSSAIDIDDAMLALPLDILDDQDKGRNVLPVVANRAPLAELHNVVLPALDTPPQQAEPSSTNPFAPATSHSKPVGQQNAYTGARPSALPPHLLRDVRGSSSRTAQSSDVHTFSTYSQSTTTSFNTPGSPALSSAARSLGTGFRTPSRTSSKKFVTPFKAQKTPASLPSAVPASQRVVHYGTPVSRPPQIPNLGQALSAGGGPSTSRAMGKDDRLDMTNRVFDLEYTPHQRNTALAYGLRPEAYNRHCLLTEYKFPPDIFLITPSTAPYYAFWSPSNPDHPLDSSEAYDCLLRRGCTLVTREWIDNHWSLILWKLSALVRACPTELQERWSWTEVIRQLLYRYEREINRGQRPAIRKVQEQDTSAARPMVLTVCEITWSEEQASETGQKTEAHPDFVLTDGWYKIRATVDEALARATRKGNVQVGSKIAMSGVKLDAKKEGTEVLKAFNDSHLVLTGNSTSLARWHTKLGFQSRSFVATLGSLSHDGGQVMLLDLVVLKIFPMGYIDSDNGNGEMPISRCQAEEDQLDAEWRKQRGNAEGAARAEMERRLSKLEGLIDRLERTCGHTVVDPDSIPSTIEDSLEELEDHPDPSSYLASKSHTEKTWLLHAARSKLDNDRMNAAQEMEDEVNSRCPPREVRNFRVVRVQDFQTVRRPALRTAQLTVWDVLSMGDGLREGGRYLVTNVVPNQKGSWRGPNVEGEVFLSTRRNSRWKAVL